MHANHYATDAVANNGNQIKISIFLQEKFCKPSNFVVMEKTYKFIYPITNEILPGLISSAAKYGRTLLVTPKGAAFQIGCVQTAVKTCQGISG